MLGFHLGDAIISNFTHLNGAAPMIMPEGSFVTVPDKVVVVTGDIAISSDSHFCFFAESENGSHYVFYFVNQK